MTAHVPQVSIAPYVAWRNVDGELVLFDRRSGTYHALNGVASVIWRGVSAGLPRPALVQMLAERYSAAPATIGDDVDRFFATALDKGLLQENAP